MNPAKFSRGKTMAKVKEKLSPEELVQRIAEVELETKLLNLKAAERSNADAEQREELRHRQNQQRQSELAQLRAARLATVRSCRHKSGGRPETILKGGGVGSFSVISRTLMPDGVTLFLQCPRCRMAEYTPEKPVKPVGATAKALEDYQDKLEDYAATMDRFNDLLEASIDAGFDNFMRGPTFAFKTEDGVPFIPARV